MKALCIGVLTILFILLGNVNSNSFRCSRYCKENWNKFGYKTENTYHYKYNSFVKTTVSGAHAQTELLIKSNVDINVISNCNYVMQLTNASYEEVYANKAKLRRTNVVKEFQDLSKQPLYFSFQNGRIDTVCPGDESNHILHIKKAILSAFQNSMPNFEEDALVYETDISGICDTKYAPSNTNRNLVIKKIKNLENCSHRKLQHTSWTATPYSKNIPKSTSLLKSTQECTQVINRDFILESSQCFEKHLFRPFSNKENGATTHLTQTLTFVSETKGVSPIAPRNYRYDSLLNNYNYETTPVTKDTTTAKILLENLEETLESGLESQIPTLFSRLTKKLKHLSQESLIKIFEATQSSSKQKKFLLDAMPLITTPDGIIAMRLLHENKIISDSQINSWLSSLLFTTDISLSVIRAMIPLMNSNSPIKEKAILSGSTLIYTYCKQDPQCFHKQDVQNLIKIIEEPLKNTCAPRSWKNHGEILLALKGIGNIGVDNSLEYLKKCYTNDDAPLELRLAAIAAHRRVSCLDNLNLEHLIDYFGQINQNVEIRIASYLAAMQCASYATIAKVKDVLRHEEINQVGSFVWTHLTNLQESSSQLKRSLKSLVENEFFRNKFSTDLRKYSRNYEMSTFFDLLNAGGTVESNVVFTSESYLPKSLMLNFTLDLFGETVNVFEFGTRMEGFEPTVENLFGPDGYFPEESLKNMLEGAKNMNASQFHTRKEPSGLIYSKIFGNEFFYTHFTDLESFVKEPNVLESLMKPFKQQTVDYSKTLVFLDSSYKIPTLVGLALELTTNGTAFLGLEINGKMDLKDLSGHKSSIVGKIYPRCAVDIIGSMSIESFDKQIGLISKNTLNSNAYLDGHVFVNKGKLVDLKLNVPKKEMNVIKVESQAYFVNDEMFSMDDVTDNVEIWEGCTERSFSNITGLKICQNVRFVNASDLETSPYFPLTGHFKYSMKILKLDVFDSYHLVFDTHSESEIPRPIYKMSFNFDTPNSLIDRRIKAYYLLDCEKLSFNSSLNSPFVNFDIHAKVGGDVDNLGFVLQTKLNDKEIILAKLALKSTQFNDTWNYKPAIDLRYKNSSFASLSGDIDYLEGKKYGINFKLRGILKEAIYVFGDLNLNEQDVNIAATIKSNLLNGNFKAIMVRNYESTSILSNVVYDYESKKKESLDFEYKQNFTRKNNLFKDSVYLSLNSSQKPFYDTLVSFQAQRNKLYFENVVVAKFFTEVWETRQLFKFYKFNGNTDIAVLLNLKGVKRNIDYVLNFFHFHFENKFQFGFLAQLDRVQRLETRIDYLKIPSQNRTFSFLFYYPRQALIVNGSLTQKVETRDILIETFYEEQEQTTRILLFSGEYTNSTVYHFENHTVIGSLQIFENGIKVFRPWIFSSSVQISPDLFINTITLRVNNDNYLSHVTWSGSSVSGLLQINKKELFALSAMKSKTEVSLLFGLNVYQHFELNVNFLMPYRRFHFLIYWDKDRDITQKASLAVNSKINQGLYLIEVEYPNQRVTASLVILPVQVTINVTWGLESAKRIYLKAGNKVYDIGGIWFAKLATPFTYLEYQEVQLSYYIIPQNAELKLDMVWSDKKINLVLSGMKSKDRLNGYLDVNTTIKEISKIRVAGSHMFNRTKATLGLKSDFTLILNNHQILGQLLWKSNGSKISSNFEIVSPSQTILPISGLLLVNNYDTTSRFKAIVDWMGRNVSADFKLKNTNSYLTIETPFRGFEFAEAKYSLIEEGGKLELEIKVDVLNELHYALISWSADEKVSVARLKITCPMVGAYNIFLKHSTVFGYFDEIFEIDQNGYEIILLKLQGEFASTFLAKGKASAKLFEHSGELTIENSLDPLRSLIESKWDQSYAVSFLGKTEDEFKWTINSSLLEENVVLKYGWTDSSYDILVYLLENLNFAGEIGINENSLQNDFDFKFGSQAGTFRYYHNLSDGRFDHRTIFKIDQSLTNVTIFYDWNNKKDRALVRLLTPWNSPLELEFSMDKNKDEYRPLVFVKYLDNTVFNLNCLLHFGNEFSKIRASLKSAYMGTLNLKIKSSVFHEGRVLGLEGTLSSYTTLVNSSLNYNLLDKLKTGNLTIFLPELKHQIDVRTQMMTQEEFFGKFLFSSTFVTLEKLFLDFNFGVNSSYLKLGKNDKEIIVEHSKNDSDKSGSFYHSKLTLTSTVYEIPNGSSELLYKNQNGMKEVQFLNSFGRHRGNLDGYLKFLNKNSVKLDSQFKSEFYKISNGSRLDYFRLDANGAMEFKDFTGKFYGIVSTNVPNMKKMECNLVSDISKNKQSVEAFLTYNRNEVVLRHHFEAFSKDLNVLMTFRAPAYGHEGKLKIFRDGNVLNTLIVFDDYNITLVTEYETLLTSKTNVRISSPSQSYNGGIFCNFTLFDGKVAIFGDFDKELINGPTLCNPNCSHWNLSAEYDLFNKKAFHLYITNENGSFFEADVKTQSLHLKLGDYVNITGTHALSNLNNVSLDYRVYLDKNESYQISYLSKLNISDGFNYTTLLSSNFVVFNLSSNLAARLNYGEAYFFTEIQTFSEHAKKLALAASFRNDRSLLVDFKQNERVLLKLNKKINEFYLMSQNRWRPFSFQYGYSFDDQIKAMGKVCWNLSKSNVSQFGGEIDVNKNVSVKIILPTRTVSLKTAHFVDQNNRYYFGKFSWFKEEQILASFMRINNKNHQKYDFKFEMPFRLVEFCYDVENFYNSSSKSKIDFKWNKSNSSQIYFDNFVRPGQLESKLFLPVLEKEVILKLDSKSSKLKVELEYSKDVDKLLLFELTSDKFERRIILRHPASKIDYVWLFKLYKTDRTVTGNMTFSYVNYFLNRPEEIGSSVTVGKLFEISGNIQTVKNYLGFVTKTKSGKDSRGFSIITQLDRKERLEFEANVISKPSGPSVAFKANRGSTRNYELYLGFPSKRELTAQIVNTIFDRETTDGRFILKLNSSQILWLKVNWRNNWLSKFKTSMFEDYYDLRYIVEEIGQQFIDAIDDGFGEAIFLDFADLQQNLWSKMTREINLIGDEYERIETNIRNGCRANSFYCKDVLRASKFLFPNQSAIKIISSRYLANVFKSFGQNLANIKNDIAITLKGVSTTIYNKIAASVKFESIKELKDRARVILKTGIDEARKSLREMDLSIDRIGASLEDYIDTTKRHCEQFFEPHLKLLDDFVIYVEQRLAILQLLVLDILDEVQYYILNLRESREVLKAYMWYVNWLEEIHLTDILEPIANVIEAILEVVITDTKNIIRDYRPYINSISEAIFGNYEEINKLFPLENIRKTLNEVYHKAIWIWNYHNLSESIKKCFHKILSEIDDYLSELLMLDYEGNEFENILGQSDYVFRPEIGVIEITQPLPIEWEAFDEMPHFNQISLYNKLKRAVENLIQLERYHFVDLFNNINSYIGESSRTLLAPPTNNIGMIVGSSHYITFDKKYYHFVGECSYMLASDYFSKSFSVVINYELNSTRINKRSLSVINDGTNLEISPDFVVTLNKEEIDLPLITDSLIVTLENSKVIVEHYKGLKLMCNLEYDFCMVELSGWLFGKTRGLLGTLDNEKFTDMKLPDGNRTSDLFKFVQSWKVGSNCTDYNRVNEIIKKNISPLTLTLYETLCQVFFVNVNSPIGNCFNSVDPKPFYDMCLNNMKQILNSTICSTVGAYKAQCARSNVNIQMPELCVYCKNGIGLSDAIFDRDNSKSVDVIIIKEEGCSNSVHNLTVDLNANLKKRGFSNNKFLVVGYGGLNEKPYVFTTNKQTWNSANNVEINNNLKRSKMKQKLSVIKAIKFALNLEFRPGVSKQFVLMQCNSNSDDENLNILHNTFLEHDIVFHVLNINRPNEQLLELYDKDHILYIQNGANVDSTGGEINAISVGISDQITDIYSLLALSTNGTVLNLTNKIKEEDKILKTWTQIISQTAYKSPCQKCKCVANSDGNGKIECTRCMSLIVKQLLSEYESNVMEFYEESDEYV